MRDELDWAKEFKEFLETEPLAPPLGISHEVMARVRLELDPSPFIVFLKVALCAAFSGALSLTLCPQFGVGVSSHSNVHHLFMGLGSIGCSLACGAFFTAAGVVLGALILRPEELRLVRSNRMLLLSALSALSLSAFVCLGAAVFLETGLVWFFGSWLGGFIGIEVASAFVFRNRLARQ